MNNETEQLKHLNAVCDGWKHINYWEKKGLVMPTAPCDHKVYKRSVSRIKDFNIDENDSVKVKSGYQQIYKQLKKVGKRRLDVQKFALIGIAILLVLYGTKLYSSYKYRNNAMEYSDEKIEHNLE